VPIFTWRGRDGHELTILEPIYVEKTRDVHADVEAGMAQLIPVLEHGIRSCIDQWVMFQRVWLSSPPESMRVFPTGSPLESPLLEKVALKLPEKRPADDGASLPRQRGSEPDAAGE
jgi:hypothetical protein